MKKILSFLIIALLVYAPLSLYFLDKSYFACPIEYKRDIIIRSDDWGDGLFGAGRRGRRLHQGIDLFAEVGTPVLAARSGKVISAKQNRGMGDYVVIKHKGNIISIYGHLSKIYVTSGEFVRQSQLIGLAGKTGNANHRAIQPHLHFEIRKDGVPCDPLEYLE